MHKELPINLKLIVYREEKDALRFLLLCTSGADSDTWGLITSPLGIYESLIDCIFRKLYDDTRILLIEPFANLEEVWRSRIERDGDQTISLAYALKVNRILIKLGPSYKSYQWCSYQEALELLSSESSKQALRAVMRYHRTPL